MIIIYLPFTFEEHLGLDRGRFRNIEDLSPSVLVQRNTGSYNGEAPLYLYVVYIFPLKLSCGI